MTIAFTAVRDVPDTTSVLVVPVFAGRQFPDEPAATINAKFLAAQGFDGKVGETIGLLASDGGTVLAVGLGDPDKITAETFRTAGAAIVKAASKATEVTVSLLDTAPRSVGRANAARALAEGMALAAYRFNTYKGGANRGPDKGSGGKGKDEAPAIQRVTAVVNGERNAVKAGLQRGARIAEAVCLARDLVNEPAGTLTPSNLADRATDIAADNGLKIEVFDEDRIAAERLGGLAGVARGSEEPARLIKLTYDPEGGASKTVALVGKGITFDSGGLSLKSGDGMMTMKTDMGGGAAVIAAMSALRDLEVPVRVIGFIPATENMPSGRAIKPGDILTARNGTTMEVLNTDAEGRLVLADGLCLAVEEKPDAIIDIATLTGAQVVALGKKIAGVMGNDDALVARVVDASERSGEKSWPLPLPDEYRSHIDSEIADIKNIGNPGQAGTLVAGLFLKEFVGDVPWAHLDIAGPARSDKDEGYYRRGGTGFGVRTLIELVAGFGS